MTRLFLPWWDKKGVSTVICGCDRLCLCQCVIKVPRHLMHELDDIHLNIHIARQYASLAMNMPLTWLVMTWQSMNIECTYDKHWPCFKDDSDATICNDSWLRMTKVRCLCLGSSLRLGISRQYNKMITDSSFRVQSMWNVTSDKSIDHTIRQNYLRWDFIELSEIIRMILRPVHWKESRYKTMNPNFIWICIVYQMRMTTWQWVVNNDEMNYEWNELCKYVALILLIYSPWAISSRLQVDTSLRGLRKYAGKEPLSALRRLNCRDELKFRTISYVCLDLSHHLWPWRWPC